MTRVVVVGAGFAGLAAVRALRGSGIQTTLVDRNVYATFQPLLYQVATGGLNPGDVAYPVRGFAAHRKARFRRGAVVGIEDHQVALDDGTRLPFDYLIIGTGVTTNHFGIPGAAEHSFALYTRREAIILRDALMGRLEYLAENPGGQLSLVVVGGGPTGVEAAGALAELCGAGIRAAFPEIDPARVSVVLVERGGELLTAFQRKLRKYALRQLRRRGIDVRLETAVREVGERTITLEDGSTLPADLTVWAAGIGAPPQIADWGLKQGHGGRILVGPDLRVPDRDDIFATGDIALDPDSPTPQLAQPAIQMGTHAAEQILRLEAGEPTTPFHYRYKGDAATIGRNAAVIQLPRDILLTGPIAWLGWLGLHIVMLLGLRNRISTLLNLGWRYLAWPHGSSLIVGDSPRLPSET